MINFKSFNRVVVIALVLGSTCPIPCRSEEQSPAPKTPPKSEAPQNLDVAQDVSAKSLNPDAASLKSSEESYRDKYYEEISKRADQTIKSAQTTLTVAQFGLAIVGAFAIFVNFFILFRYRQVAKEAAKGLQKIKSNQSDSEEILRSTRQVGEETKRLNEETKQASDEAKKIVGDIHQKRKLILKESSDELRPIIEEAKLGLDKMTKQVEEKFSEYAQQGKILEILGESLPFETYFAMGVNYSNKEDYENSEKYFLKAKEKEPNIAVVHFNLGLLYQRQEKFVEAETYYKKAIELDPKYASAHNNLGSLYEKQGKLAEAEASYKKAIELDPKYALPHNNLGWFYEKQGKLAEAEAYYKKAIELDPKNASAHNNLGWLYEKQGKLAEAEAYCKQAIVLNPTHSGAHIDLGLVYRRQGNLTEAETYYKKAIELDPKNVAAHFNLGWNYEGLEKFSEAEIYYKKAVELDPANALLQLSLFLVFHRAGKPDEADVEMKEFVKILEGNDWPASVARFYAGEISEADVLKAAEDKDPKKDKEQKCEAYYYVGMAHLLGIGAQRAVPLPEREVKAKEYFEKCLATGVKNFVEYQRAESELEKMEKK